MRNRSSQGGTALVAYFTHVALCPKRLERGRFIWPLTRDGVVALSAGQLAYLLEGIDWRNPQASCRPTSAG